MAKLFNFKKHKKAQMAPAIVQPTEGIPGIPDFGSENPLAGQYEGTIDQGLDLQNQSTKFLDASELHDFLNNNDYITIRDFLNEQNISVEELSKVEELLKRYYENQGETTSEEELETSIAIFNMLPTSLKQEPEGGEVTVPAQFKEFANMNKINSEIEKFAKNVTNKKQKPFNLTKVAQHHTDQNVIMWGPGEKRIDPFLRQPVSDWHILERNKGFGQDIDGVWNIDWETFWRGNIMDKYSRPYRDTKTGEWVGGYIQKRFEVDKNIPETSNYQLLPGERRKPRIPEHGVLEGRLQAMRAKNERGYGPETNTSKPFNWNTASSSRTIKKGIAVANDTFKISPELETEWQAEIDQPDENYNLTENEKLIVRTRFNTIVGDPVSAKKFIALYDKSPTVAAIKMLRLQSSEPNFEAMKNYMQNLYMQEFQSQMIGGEGLGSRVASKKKVV